MNTYRCPDLAKLGRELIQAYRNLDDRTIFELELDRKMIKIRSEQFTWRWLNTAAHVRCAMNVKWNTDK